MNVQAIESLKAQVIKMIEEIQNDNTTSEIFGQLSTYIPSWVRIYNNRKYDNFYIYVKLGSDKLEICSDVESLKLQVEDWFNTMKKQYLVFS